MKGRKTNKQRPPKIHWGVLNVFMNRNFIVLRLKNFDALMINVEIRMLFVVGHCAAGGRNELLNRCYYPPIMSLKM